jgi:hypothetical protein
MVRLAGHVPHTGESKAAYRPVIIKPEENRPYESNGAVGSIILKLISLYCNVMLWFSQILLINRTVYTTIIIL